MVWSGNARTLENLFNQRLCKRALKEFQDFAKELKKQISELDEESKWIADNLYVPKCVRQLGICFEARGCGLFPKYKDFKPYLDMWMEKRKELGIKSDWLFPMYDYKKQKWVPESPINVDTIDSWANVISARTTKPFYWHSMRHYFTTKLAKSNIPEGVIADIIGWSDTSLIAIYDDSPKEESFSQYFGAEGIKKVEKGSLDDM